MERKERSSDEQKNVGEEEVEESFTMAEVLELEKEMEDEYAVVLGASDEKCCTYAQGSVSRQALYSCLTCCPKARDDLENCAGICLACSYHCHENHELVELYTKRNFRCDCPTERFGKEHRCTLNSTLKGLQPRNADNLYNQNFQGIYCNCNRPYPNPEHSTQRLMLQCAICEDWFHLEHLDVKASAAKLVDIYSELICNGCMLKHDFLRDYTGLALKPVEDADDSQANITVGCETTLHCEDNNDNKLRSDLDKSISEIMGEGGETVSEEPDVKRAKIETNQANNNDTVANDSDKDDVPSTSKVAAESQSETCKRPNAKNSDYEKGATFWSNDWRAALCRCAKCIDIYKAQKVDFLLDPNDSAETYEERGKRRAAAAESSYEQGIRALASIGRVQQIDAITEYNHMKDKLIEYLQTFALSNKVVTEEDINRFFAQMRSERNTQLGQPHFCR